MDHCWDCSDQIGISNHINENKNRTFEGDKDSNRSLLKEHTSPSLNFARCSVQTWSVSDSIYGNMSCKTTRGLVSLVVIFRKRSIWLHGWHCKTAGCPIDFQEILDKCMAYKNMKKTSKTMKRHGKGMENMVKSSGKTIGSRRCSERRVSSCWWRPTIPWKNPKLGRLDRKTEMMWGKPWQTQ